MITDTYSADFWRWYLQETFSEFDLHENQTIINNVENLFGAGFDLTLNLSEAKCIDSTGSRYELAEYIALLLSVSIRDIEIRLEVEHERWKGQRMAEQERMEYFRDIEEYKWYRRKGSESVVVTEFDLILESVIEKWNIKTQEWERYYEGKLRYVKFGRPVIKEFRFDPVQTHSASEFSKAVWDKDFLEVKNMRDSEVRSFWWHVDYYYKPRVVREFNHSGFIDFEGTSYFLTGNLLVKFPAGPGERLQLIAEQEGAFPVEENKYVKPPDDAIHLPMFDLGVADPSTGRYLKRENMLMDPEDFKRNLVQVESHLCSMIGGNTEFRLWGKLLIGYAFSFFFFDDIYGHFKHVLFIYLYGEGNVGKGEVAKRILDFWGINYLDSLNTPKARNVDIALEQHSQLPVWIDEHLPEIPGIKAEIKDQDWNSWFELKQRFNAMKTKLSFGTERKEVRTMPLFCSNFKPVSDHLLSRCIILHYRKESRGPEKHVRWLAQERQLLQLLTLSFMQHYNTINRKAFVWDLDRIRDRLKTEVKTELKEKFPDAFLQDRQISQFATLLTVWHWLDSGYQAVVEDAAIQIQKLESESDTFVRETQQKMFLDSVNSAVDNDLYGFVKKQILSAAVSAAHKDPLTDYIETIGALIQAGKITTRYFGWTPEGHLKFWAKAVWDIYEHEKRGSEYMARRDQVEEKLKQISELSSDGELKTIAWKDTEDSMDTQRAKGFYITDAVEKELFRIAFNYEKYRPAGAPSWYSSNYHNTRDNVKENNELTYKTINDDDLPF